MSSYGAVMSKYQRILALVDSSADSFAVAQRALQMSRIHGATLALATVIDATSDVQTEAEGSLQAHGLLQSHMSDVKEKLLQMSIAISCDRGCEIIVCHGSQAKAVTQLTNSWRPDLVLVDASASHRTEHDYFEMQAYDVLLVQNGRPDFATQLINALAAKF